MKDSKLVSKGFKRGTGIHNWYSYFIVLSGSYLYFFNSGSDLIASTYYYVKDCTLIDISAV